MHACSIYIMYQWYHAWCTDATGSMGVLINALNTCRLLMQQSRSSWHTVCACYLARCSYRYKQSQRGTRIWPPVPKPAAALPARADKGRVVFCTQKCLCQLKSTTESSRLQGSASRIVSLTLPQRILGSQERHNQDGQAHPPALSVLALQSNVLLWDHICLALHLLCPLASHHA